MIQRLGIPFAAVLALLIVRLQSPLPAAAANPQLAPGHHVTIQQEIELGNEVANKVRRQLGGPWNNPAQLIRVRQIAWRLFNVSDRHQNPLLRRNFSVELLSSNVINAMCVPGGHTFVTRGLIELGINDNELACVMGHEIAHAARRHGARNLEESEELQNRFDSFTKRDILRKMAQVGILVLLFKHFDPQLEFEADYYGEIYAARAGYDPSGMVTLFERFNRMQSDNSPTARLKRLLLSVFDNHPPTPERIERARAEAERIHRGERLPTTPVPIYM